MKLFLKLLKKARAHQISDIHLRAAQKVIARKNKSLVILEKEAIPKGFLSDLAKNVMSSEEWLLYSKNGKDIHCSFSHKELGRFRLCFFKQQGQLAVVCRLIAQVIPSIQQLGLPSSYKKVATLRQGLVLITGAAGSGKTTSLASMIEYRNQSLSGHIVTLEDPIEFTFEEKKSLITQREIGVDVSSFEQGLQSSLRLDPDVIMIGEIRDAQTMKTALMAAETGHLVLATLHTVDAIETIYRVLSFFDAGESRSFRHLLASSLKAIFSQKLVPSKNEQQLIPVCEILLNTLGVKECLLQEGKESFLKELIEGGAQLGMQSFDQDLMAKVLQRKITDKVAMRYSSTPHNFNLGLKGYHKGSDAPWKSQQPGARRMHIATLGDLKPLKLNDDE